ncbi:MAG: TonB family protein [Pseudomonadota bacterium]
MPLEQIKTQVLLLHSEQSTLDTLRAGFNDRYTVHCATSGTEALNTLGETPIHVIISAQKLPGMSGVEALREAKKRSPETIGILLAGRHDKGLEALVGEKEVFQVVRGGISGDELGKLIDNATRQMRLMALAESANDTRANPDESGQHIVMETSENGATIISDGTGTVPILDPKRVSAAVAAGAQAVDVLVLSKDQEFLTTIRESTRGLHHVFAADTLAAAEDAITKNKVGVVVVDAGMVGSNVEKLTVHLRRSTKRLVSIVAGRRDDGEMLMDLINRGKVYRFLLKPVSPGRARLAIEASVKHHLEAPDSAFKIGAGADKPQAAAKPEARKPAKPARQPAEAKAPEPTTPAAAKEATEKRKEPVILPDIDIEAPDDTLSDAFDEKDKSFTETMTGIVATVSESIKGKTAKTAKKETPAETPPAPPPFDNLEAADSGGGSLFSNPAALGGIAAALVAVVGIGYWMLSGEDQPATVESQTTNTATPAAAAPAPAQEETSSTPAFETDQPTAEELASAARRLRDAGQIYAPAGDNAVEAFAAATLAEPGDRALADEFADVVDQTISLGEAAMLDGRVADAAEAIGRVGEADPGHPRLAFLTAQLQQMQLRESLASARAAILDSRYQDAADAIATARSLNPADTRDIDIVEAELSDARSAERVEDVLATAADRLQSGQLLEPANDNARYYYELALSNDPGNTAAQAGLKMISSTLVLEARAAIDEGRFGTAERLLSDVREIDAQSAELASASRALGDARQRVADEQRRQAELRAAAERQAEADRQEAARLAQQKADEEAAALAAAATSTPAEAVGDNSDNGAIAAVADNPAASGAAASPGTSVPSQSSPAAAAAGGSLDEVPVAISSLTRTKYVAPKYPRAAERRSLSGWVDVVFTVQVDGTVADIQIRESEPGDVFVNSAIKAVEKWEFEPVIENDRYVEKQAGVRMMFAIE